MKRLLVLSAALAGFAGDAALAEVSDEVIRNAFQLYETAPPKAPGYEPGVKITKDNVDAMRGILDPFTARYVKQRDRGVNAAAMAGILFGAPESPAETPASGRGLKLAKGA